MKRKVRHEKAKRLVIRNQRKGVNLLRKRSLAVGLLNVNGYSQATANDVELAVSTQDVHCRDEEEA